MAGFGARYAYTMDGGARGELEFESFSADAIVVTFRGFNTHPGFAKGRMVNAIKLAATIHRRGCRRTVCRRRRPRARRLRAPLRRRTPAWIRPAVKLLVRDFVTAGLAEKEAWLKSLAQEVVAGVPGASFEFQVEESYRNMREVHRPAPGRGRARARGDRPARASTVRERAIRGGTDGSRLSFMGLPTPNIFAGEQNFHSRLEWVSVQDMEKAVEVIVELARVWEEHA